MRLLRHEKLFKNAVSILHLWAWYLVYECLMFPANQTHICTTLAENWQHGLPVRFNRQPSVCSVASFLEDKGVNCPIEVMEWRWWPFFTRCFSHPYPLVNSVIVLIYFYYFSHGSKLLICSTLHGVIWCSYWNLLLYH